MMNVLVTGAKGFVGKNLCAMLQTIRDGRCRTHSIPLDGIFEADIDTPAELLEEYCGKADFVFHLAGVNRPEDPAEFMAGNRDFTAVLLEKLKKREAPCPVMLSSSLQATLIGRYDAPYGRSKLAGEELVFSYSRETGAEAFVYRFPNLFGKWCRPNYNSVTATFCHNIANDLPIRVDDPATELELVYIDDLMEEMLDLLEGHPHRCRYDRLEAVPDEKGQYCHVPVSHRVKLGEMAELLRRFRAQPDTLEMPAIPADSFAKKLYSTYLSYLPREKVSFPLRMNIDHRGSFTELLRTENGGQFSVNILKPGIVKGQHWHHTKWEFFIVVSGHGLIRQRKLGSEEIIETEVSGEKIEAVHILPGYTHDIVNLSESEDLVTIMWANEPFDPDRSDTYYEKV